MPVRYVDRAVGRRRQRDDMKAGDHDGRLIRVCPRKPDDAIAVTVCCEEVAVDVDRES